MKKRTLVCFLIFLLCVIHSSIPDTVFGQGSDPTPTELAKQVFDEHNQVLRRASVKQYLPQIIEGLKGELPLGLTPLGVINLAISSIKNDPTGEGLKDAAKLAGLTLTDDHIAIIADADVQKVLEDDTTKALLSLTGNDLTIGLDELLRLINEAEEIGPPEQGPPTLSITTSPPTTEQKGSFDVEFTTADVNVEDTVTVTASISVDPVEAIAYYSRTVTGNSVRVMQTAPTAAMPMIPGATVTLTLVANDGTADSSPATFEVMFGAAEFIPQAPPTLSITTSPPTTEPVGSFDVAFTTADVNGDAVGVRVLSYSVEPVEAKDYYHVPIGMVIGNSVRITQTAPTEEMPTIPGATVTLTLVANDGTEDSAEVTFEVKFDSAQKSTAPPLPPPDLSPSNFKGKSKVGGLSLNLVNLRAFIRELIVVAAGRDVLDAINQDPDELVEPVVRIILQEIPDGFLPEKQIEQALTRIDSWSIFDEGEDSQLDPENFGNAITPSLVFKDFSDIFNPENEVKKYLTSDNLNVFVRVPSTLSDGDVVVRLVDENDQITNEEYASRITDQFQKDTIPYTFRLEETLAATNLPALPHTEGVDRIFSEVFLRYSRTGLDGVYVSERMEPVAGKKGVVWEHTLGIPPPEEAADPKSYYYFFDVKLSKPVTLKLINPRAIGDAIQSPDGTFDPNKAFGDGEIGDASTTHTISSWRMPDPRNLQMGVRQKLFEQLFTPDVKAALAPIAFRAIADPDNFKISGNERLQLQNALIISANSLFKRFESTFDSTFDPLLSSVFSLPIVDTTKESLWYANIDSIEDSADGGPVKFDARVINATGGELDHIVASIAVDDSAPEASINIDTAGVATGYRSKIQDDVFVATANSANTSDLALVNITSTLTKGSVGHGAGYLLYQLIKVDEHRRPLNTWEPLTVQTSMLASDLWELALEAGSDDQIRQLLQSFLPSGQQLPDFDIDKVRESLRDFGVAGVIDALKGDSTLEAVLQALLAPLGINIDLATLISLGIIEEDTTIESILVDIIGNTFGVRITPEQYALYANLLGAVVDDLNLFPLTTNPSIPMAMPIQGENMPLMLGNYGIRAMGIDTLFNVGSHVAPTYLRVVKSEDDSSKITMARFSGNEGDINFNGKIDDYEKNTIYANARELILTIMVDERSGKENQGVAHPGMITVQYENADGEWVTIGDPIDLVEAGHPEGTTFEHPWTVSDFDDLVGAGEYVRLRTITTNELGLTRTTAEEKYHMVELDDDVHPVDPKVLVVDFNDDSIVMTNPDSGAPQGTIELIAYTPRRTEPATASIQVQAKRMKDEEDWAVKHNIGTAELSEGMSDREGISGTDTAAITFNGKALADVYVEDMLHIQDSDPDSDSYDKSGSYHKWVITLDTTALADTIEMDNLAAAHAASNPDGKSYSELDTNRYMLRAYAVDAGGNDISDAVQGDDYTDMFSVDNVDDVAPLGQNIITVSQDDVDVTANEDGSFNVGGLVDKYTSESPVITLTITPTLAVTPEGELVKVIGDTYDTVHLHTSLPVGAIIGEATETEEGSIVVATETAEGSGVYTVMVDVGTLMDADDLVHNDRYLEDWAIENPDEFIYNPKGKVFSFTAYALTEDAAGNKQKKDNILNADLSTTTAHEITVNVQNTYRPDSGVLAITLDNSDGMVNPDSGAPQGELTFDVYTYGMTSAPTEGVRVEAQRPIDDTWERITGTAVPATLVNVSEVAVTDLSDILTDAANAGIMNSGVISALVGISEAEGESPASLMKWSYKVDTRELAKLDADEDAIKLDDTINRGDGESERDVSKDENQYVVRAYALTPKNLAQVEYPKRDEYLERGGVEAFFSLDNVDDVPPLGPTNITDIADHVGSLVANEDGSFTARGIVDDNVESTKLAFSIEPTAEPITYVDGMIRLVQTAPDGTETELPPVGVSEGQITVDIGNLDNGTYMYYALVADKEGNWQVQGELDKPSPVVTVHVLNFRVSDIMGLMVTEVDGVSVTGELPDPIPLRDSIAVSFNVDKGTLFVDDLTGVVVGGQFRDGDDYTAESDGAGAFSLSANNLMELSSQHTTPHGRVQIRERFVDFPLANINLDNTKPTISFVSPVEGEAVNDLPTLNAMFNDGELGVGISDANTVVVSLARIRPNSDGQEEIDIGLGQGVVEQDIDSVVYTRVDKLAGGAYKFTVQVSDSLGNIGENSVAFAVEGIDPTVVITAPASGQEFDASPNSVTGFFSGGGDVKITKFTVNDDVVDVSAESESLTVKGNNFTYMPADGFSEDAHTVSVEVTDGSGLTSQTALTFIVEYPIPTATITTPTAGQVYNHGKPIITGTFSGADPVKGTLTVTDSDDKTVSTMEVSGNAFEYSPAEALGHGSYTVTVMVTDINKRTAEASTKFSVDIAGPSVAIHAPASGQMFDHGMPDITVESSGVAGIESVSVTVNGKPAKMNEDGTYSPAEALADGDHTVVATVKDKNGKKAEATVIFSVRLPVPTASITTPTAGQVYDHGMPIITGTFSGAVPVKGTLTVTDSDDKTVSTMEVSGNGFEYTPTEALGHGSYTVTVKVTDDNKRTAEASTKFSVDIAGPSIAIHAPASGQMFDHGMPVITVEYSGVAGIDKDSVSVTVDGKDAVLNEEDGTYKPAEALEDGDHTVVAKVTDKNNKTAEATVIFSVEIPGPSVVIHSPAAGQMFDHGMPVITVEYSGVAGIDKDSVSVTVDGKDAVLNEEDGTYKPAEALEDGDHTVVAKVTDKNNKTAEATVIFSVEIPGPSVVIHSPAAGQMYSHDEPVITWESSGVATPIVTTLTINNKEIELADDAVSYEPKPEDGLGEGEHTVVVMVKDANNKTAQATAVFTVEFPMVSVTLTSPTAGHSYTNGTPVISGEFTGVGDVTVKVKVAGKDAKVTIDQDGNQFTAEHPSALGHGMHKVEVEVTDANNEKAAASAEFMVDLPGPTVAILSPAPGHTYGNGEKPVITVEFSGEKATVKSFTINNGDEIDVESEGNMFVHTPEGLTTGEYIVDVVVEHDANDKTARDTVVFNVKLDDSPPVIAEVAPSGILKDTWVNISVVVSDDQSDITAVDFFIRNEADTHKGFLPLGTVIAGSQNSATTQQIADGNILTQGSFADGTHTLKVVATSEGGSSSHTWSFTVVTDNIAPIITSVTPTGTIHAGLPTISASAHDESGVEEMTIVVRDSNSEVVEGETLNDATETKTDDDGNIIIEVIGITRIDFIPNEPLDEGTYSIEVRAKDTHDNSSTAKGVFTVDFDTAAPIITSSSPQNGARLMYAHDAEKRPTISITYGDAETGVDVESIRFVFNDQLINLTNDQKSATQVIYMPPADLEPGKYTVKIEVSDNARMQERVSGAREANTAVYVFSFFVEHGDVPILRAAPFNYPNPFKDNTRISFVLARRSNVSITIYDVTLRPVRVLVDNEVMEAGYYTPAGDSKTNPYSSLGWDGKSSNGEDLARGIYICEIIVTDGVEPEYAFLKLALTR